MCRKSIRITPFLNQKQLLTSVRRPVIVVLDVSVFRTAGDIYSFCYDHLQKFFSHPGFAFVCYIQNYHVSPPFPFVSWSFY